MTSDKTTSTEGKSLVQMKFNAMMQYVRRLPPFTSVLMNSRTLMGYRCANFPVSVISNRQCSMLPLPMYADVRNIDDSSHSLRYPGSFRVEIRTEPNSKGECLARQGDVKATSSFNKVVVGFEEQPELEASGNSLAFLFCFACFVLFCLVWFGLVWFGLVWFL